ncbi:MAG TPA: glycosyltransferase [Nitrolancea sp.]|jgi:glycosyltransferase involved in cell wall biosynthesis|nr:glycosyltransferase [Nitrolancea sp.]
MESSDRLKLDVVIITKDQGWNARRLIESVMRETAGRSESEIILVDSASSDATVEIASEYPIRVIRLSKRQRLTAAAGRHAGLSQTHGDIVLFLDGDMELRRGWIDAALHVFRIRPDIAVVSGKVIDQPMRAQSSQATTHVSESGLAHFDEVPHGGGAAAYRRAVVDRVGSFNPYLFSDEEPELCLRIRHTGYRIVRLDRPIADHYSDPSGAISTLFGRRNRNLYLGPGQALRMHLGSGLLLAYARERGFGLLPGAGIAAGLASLAFTVAQRQPRWTLIWLGAVAALFAVDASRKRSLYRALFTMVQRLLFAEGTLKGFVANPSDPSRYPCMIEVIK